MIHKFESEEGISVVAIFDVITRKVTPWRFKWNNRDYTIKSVDMVNPRREGRTLHHVFSVWDGKSTFVLNFNTQNLKWTIVQVDDGYPN